MKLTTGFFAISSAAIMMACSDSPSSLSADSRFNADVAMLAGDAAAVDAEVMRGPHAGRFGLGLLARVGAFECDRETPRKLTVTRSCTFRDAGGTAQNAYDEQTTASIDVHVEISGEVERDRWSGSVHRERDLTVTGLAGSETSMTWNGTGTGTSTRVHISDSGDPRTFEFSGSTTITNVVIPVPRTPTGWPLSGTIARTITIEKPDGTTVTRNVSVTFNGTQFVPVTVNGETFEFDLDSRGRPRKR
jgi:hypothetical protein